MKVAVRDPYFQGILSKIDLYQKGKVTLEELKRIPKDDLLRAMHEECSCISENVRIRKEELERDFKKTIRIHNNFF